MKLSEQDDYIRQLTKLIKENPSNAKLLVARGEIYMDQGCYAVALKDINLALSLKDTLDDFFIDQAEYLKEKISLNFSE